MTNSFQDLTAGTTVAVGVFIASNPRVALPLVAQPWASQVECRWHSGWLLGPSDSSFGGGLGVGGDLGGGELAVVGFLLVPIDGFGDGFLEGPDWFPAEEVVGFVGGEV